MTTTTTPTWINSISTSVLKSDVTAAAATGIMSYSNCVKLLSDLASLITTTGVTAAEFADMKTIVTNDTNGLTTSKYLQSVMNSLVNGSNANQYWTGGASQAVHLGNLAVGSTLTQVTELTGKWLLGTDTPSAGGIIQNQNPIYTEVKTTLYGTAGAPTINEVCQGEVGDCYFLAGVGAVALENPTLIKNAIISNGNNSYGVEFFVNGNPVWVTVNDYIPTLSGAAPYANGFNNPDNASWLQLYEKAFAQLQAISPTTGNPGNVYGNAYQSINSGQLVNAIAAITGATPVLYTGSQITSSVNSIIAALNNHEAVELGSYTTATDSAGKYTLIANHAFTVTGYDTVTNEFIVRNPWGTMTSGQYWETSFEVTAAQLASVGDQISICPTVAGQTAVVPTPAVTTTNATLHGGQSLALATTVTATPVSGSTVKYYDVTTNGVTVNLNGATNLSHTAGDIQVAASQWSMLTISGAANTGTQTISISASTDGNNYGTPVTDTITTVGAVITGNTNSVVAGKSVAVSTLFTTSDVGGTILDYQFTTPTSGTINLGGATNLSHTAGVIEVAANQLSLLTYTAGSTAGTTSLGVQVYDGAWDNVTNVSLTTTAATSVAATPVITSSTHTIHGGVITPVASTFSYTGSPSFFKFTNMGGGVIQLNGATNLLGSSSTSVEVTAAQLKLLNFADVALGPDTITISASNDGVNWGASVSTDIMNVVGATVTITAGSVAVGKTVNLSTLINASDPGGTIQYYEVDFSPKAASGTVSLNGATNLNGSSYTSQGYIEVTQTDLAKLLFTGSSAGSQTIQVKAFDGAWSNIANLAMTTTASTPAPTTPGITITSNNSSVAAGHSISVASTITSTDVGGTIGAYLVFAPTHGTLTYAGGNVNSVNGVQVSAAQLSSLMYVAGSTPGADSFTIEACNTNFNGWSTPVVDHINITGAVSSTLFMI